MAKSNSNTKTIKRLGLLLGALTLITIFLISFTLARFTTAASGGGTSTVSNWDVTITPATNTTNPNTSTYEGAVSFGKLSPGTKNSEDGYLVYNPSESISLATVTYTTEVDVAFSIQSTDFTFTFNDGSTLTSDSSSVTASTVAYSVANTTNTVYGNTQIIYGADSGDNTDLDSDGTKIIYPSYSEITKLFSLSVSYSIDNGDTSPGNFDASTSSTGGHTYSTASSWTKNENGETTATITGSLLWSIVEPANGDTGYDSSGNYYWATYLCDWVGKYVKTVSCTLTYTAEQAS